MKLSLHWLEMSLRVSGHHVIDRGHAISQSLSILITCTHIIFEIQWQSTIANHRWSIRLNFVTAIRSEKNTVMWLSSGQQKNFYNMSSRCDTKSEYHRWTGDKTIRQQTVASIDAVLDWHAIKSRDAWSARNSPFALKSSSYVAYIGKNSLNGLLCDRPIAWKRAAAFTLASLRRTWLTIASFHRPPSPVDDTMKLLKLSCGGGRELHGRSVPWIISDHIERSATGDTNAIACSTHTRTSARQLKTFYADLYMIVSESK